jgi:hypothetical protein
VVLDNHGYMTLATLGSILILLGLAVVAAGVALPVAHALRLRTAARPGPRGTLHRTATAQLERVSA